MGAPEEVIARIEAGAGATDFAVWADNWPVVEAFLAVSTQFAWVPIGGGMAPARLYCSGLNYAAVDVGIRRAALEVGPVEWAALRIMEAAARDALNGIEDS